MTGSLVDALGPAALRFLRPMRVVGGGGCSYLGLSFYDVKKIRWTIINVETLSCHTFLSLSSLPSPPGGAPPRPEVLFP